MNLSFTVYGRPQPQGSIRAFMPKGRRFPVLTSDNLKLKPYREAVALYALMAMAQQVLSEPVKRPAAVCVKIKFYFKRPESAPKERTEVTVKPDVDKLARAALDALSGVAFEDDSQVVYLEARKYYGTPERTEIKLSLPS